MMDALRVLRAQRKLNSHSPQPIGTVAEILVPVLRIGLS